ncbi:U2 small nuclear ribonucleoprotein A'-like [Helianthus annuus]|uniref:U2 small nuclear ribonucleoprotein A'-like n=1 Tax=Helianthus annuus TaxID=4232 RepID=UPI000B9059A4|nr:U2 small nuclear ribonucleoprotein A'-like [Helianthus annuus]
MVRLTADLIWKSPHFVNALCERELDLRGNKIPEIENLGATEGRISLLQGEVSTIGSDLEALKVSEDICFVAGGFCFIKF